MGWFGTTQAGARAKRSRHGARRRARVAAARGAEAPLTLDELYAITKYCSRCKLFVPREQASIEHIVPLAEGGTDTPDNQAISHARCNAKKGARADGPKRKGLQRRTPIRRKRKTPEDTF